MIQNQRLIPRIPMLWWMLLLLVAIAAVAIIELNTYPLWYDEIYSLIYAGGAHYGPITPAQVMSRVVEQLQHEKNPPGFYLLLHFWIGAVGSSAVAARYLCLLAGLLAVTWTYRLGRDVAARSGTVNADLSGLAAAVAVGGSAFFIFYLHELRAYSFIVMLTAFQLWAYWRLVNMGGHRGRGLRIAFALSIALSFYLHYQSVFFVAAIAIYHVLMVKKTRWTWHVFVFLALGTLVFIPWLWVVYTVSTGSVINPLVPMPAEQIIPALILSFSNNSATLLLLLVVIVILYARHKTMTSLLVMLVIALVVSLVANLIYPYMNRIRYIIFLWPLLAVVVGLGVEHLGRVGIAPVVVLCLWVGAGAWAVANNDLGRFLNDPVPPWNDFRAALQTHSQSGDVLAFHAGDYDWIRALELDHYLVDVPISHQMMEYIPGKLENNDYLTRAGAFLSGKQRVWVAVSHIDPPNFRLNEFQRALEANGYGRCYTALADPSMSLDLYADLPQSLADTSLQFGDAIGFTLLEPVQETSPNTVTVVQSQFKASTVLADTYSVALHVMNDQGVLVGQTDFGLPAAERFCFATTITVPSGSYTVRMAVYDWRTGERLLGVDTASGNRNDEFTLGAVTVG